MARRFSRDKEMELTMRYPEAYQLLGDQLFEICGEAYWEGYADAETDAGFMISSAINGEFDSPRTTRLCRTTQRS